MKMAKKQFRIGELADRLEVERFVIRFWEKEFELFSNRSSGKQRFYDENDYAKFKEIKQLLYNEKFTISGAKNQLNAKKKSTDHLQIRASKKTIIDEHIPAKLDKQMNSLTQQMLELREKLIKLQELL